jgi:hypothetical protein
MKWAEVSRREWISMFGGAAMLEFSGELANAAAPLVKPRDAVDHLLLGIADLDRGVAWVERRTGIKAVPGGSHPGVGTRNALLSLGGRQYLEIIAPDPQQKAFNYQVDLRTMAEPRLITWAAATRDIQAIAKSAGAAGYKVFGPRDGSRARPDGRLLKWRTLGVVNKLGRDGVEPIPFFIEWDASSLHPSQDSPSGCTLQALEIEHPDPASLNDALKLLGIDANVKRQDRAGLIATLKTPKGAVELR